MSTSGNTNTGNGRPAIPPVDPVVRFLGPGAARNGPFGVLGLPVNDIDEADVLDAVHKAMDRIDSHPESSTPSADEARLAVHAAAANLIDNAVRHELLRRLAGDRADVLADDSQAPGHRSPSASGGGSLEADVLRCIAGGGGWNRQAMRHFLMIAHMKGHTSAEAMDAIRALWRGRGQPPPAGRSLSAATPSARQTTGVPDARPAQAKTPVDLETEIPEESVGRISPFLAVFITLVVGAFVFAGGWLVWYAVQVPVETAQPERHIATPSPQDSHPEGPGDDEPFDVRPDADRRRLDSGPAILHEFEVAVEGLALDAAESIKTFEKAVSALAGRWGEISPIDRLAASDQIVGFIYRVGGQRSLAERAMLALEKGSAPLLAGEIDSGDDIWRGAWSMGMLVRLRREQNLPGTIIRRIDGVLLGAPGGLSPNASTFRAGAVAALRSMARMLAEPPISRGAREGWSVWPDVARAAAGGDAALADSLLLNALESVLRQGAGESAAEEIAADLVGELNWRSDGTARAWLLRAFEDRTLGPDELHVLTLALATRSRAEGVDHSMVLSRGASEFARRQLRSRYGQVWGIESQSDRSEIVAAFVAAAGSELLVVPNEDGRDESEKLASIVRLVRLNAVGELVWRADISGASDLLESLDAPIDAVLESGQVSDASKLFAVREGTWAETYLGAGSHIPRRIELLDKLASRSDRLGPMEAEVLVTEALRGSPKSVRDAAAAVVESFSDQPTIANAVLEALPMMPRTIRNARMVELVSGVSLPRADAPDWMFQARRAVVERLLELIAGHGVYARLDALAHLLDEAYDIQLNGSGISGSSIMPASAESSVRGLAGEWADLAARRPPSGLEGYGVDEIERRRAARLAMAEGLVQRFHVEQLALAELMAQVIAAEQPGYVSRVNRMLADHGLARDRARNVLVQIEHTERLMLALRLLRFGEDRG